MAAVEVDGGPGWLQVVHGENVSNRVRGRLVAPERFEREFGSLIDDARTPSRAELTRDRLLQAPGRLVRDTARSGLRAVALRLLGKDRFSEIKRQLSARLRFRLTRRRRQTSSVAEPAAVVAVPSRAGDPTRGHPPHHRQTCVDGRVGASLERPWAARSSLHGRVRVGRSPSGGGRASGAARCRAGCGGGAPSRLGGAPGHLHQTAGAVATTARSAAEKRPSTNSSSGDQRGEDADPGRGPSRSRGVAAGRPRARCAARGCASRAR